MSKRYVVSLRVIASEVSQLREAIVCTDWDDLRPAGKRAMRQLKIALRAADNIATCDWMREYGRAKTMGISKYDGHQDFGRKIAKGRYRIFCEQCGLPMAWPEKPVAMRYWCDEHDPRPDTHADSMPSSRNAIREEADNHNTFDDVVGLHEDGRE